MTFNRGEDLGAGEKDGKGTAVCFARSVHDA